MTSAKILDVRGLSCPEPAMLTREALLSLGKGTLIVLSDSATSCHNIERTGKLAGWKAEVADEDDHSYRITLTK
ncbi:sulfurtransferase TusA family protein [Levilinea saccharolytica]|uniref:UPF0033 domain-containing protein n=1 Tax=Levilinea saccharolytica TaxID=229921 RepID=A0A0N8GP29_9CHLR|nr:sulfurtransferase TusA family protein [Levilinea saccharolytica]KPL79746.1 hypothetical protein ADN01_13750 [Levilinea saccharolytica]GAP16760.1 predicted redox protein, regulator of disulfide bond formation [Levilinea saccharolytica]